MRMKIAIHTFFLTVASLTSDYVFASAVAAPVEIPSAPLIGTCRNDGAAGTPSGFAISSTTSTSDNSFIYQSSFDAKTWSGSLKKLALMTREDGRVIANKTDWDAADILTESTSPDERKIYTLRLNDAHAGSTVEFFWSTLTDVQRGFLNTSPDDGKADGLGEKRIDYLRGIRSLEEGNQGGVFRVRARVFGDVVNSSPVFVGAPAANIQDAGYRDFYEASKNRLPAVYVGANDGMFHAFNARDGRELFAYIPGALVPTLNSLTSPGYQHRSYVDGPIGVNEAMVNGRWKTIVVSGMGGGAQGVFALDVTNPSAFGGALWEFSDADDPDMGNVIGMPLIARIQTGNRPTYFAVVSSGLNNYKSDGANRFNTDGASALFLLSLDRQSSEKWVQGVNYFKFRLPASDTHAQNGLGAPALVADISGTARYIYVGDLQGDLWRIDVSSSDSLSKASVSTTPLFVAKDAQGNRQPITMQPKIVFAPSGGYVVLFGTGRFIEAPDTAAAGFKTQSFYGVYDGKRNIVSSFDRTSLVSRFLEKSGDGFRITGADFQYGNATASSMGWYFDFPDSAHTGERAVANPVLSNGLLFLNTQIPTDACGSGRSYVFDVLTGLTKNEVTGYLSRIGMLYPPAVVQTGAMVGVRNALGQRIVQKRVSVINIGAQGAMPAEAGVIQSPVIAGRFSWREIFNWQELRNALTRK